MQFPGVRSATRAAVITVAALAGAMAVASPSRADTVTVGTLETKNVTIEKMENNQVFYKTQSGTPTSKEVKENLKLSITDEPSFNAAEDAYASKKFADAVDGYAKTLRSSNKPWLKDYAAIRLEDSAERSGRVDAAVTAWLSMLDRNPKAAADHKPKLPADSNSTYLKTALSQLDTAATSAKEADKVTTIRAFELEVARAAKDDAKVTAIASELAKGAVNNPAAGNNPGNLAAAVEGQLGLIKVACDKQDFKGAQEKLEQVKPAIVEPAQQADWLWLNAEAQAGALGDSKDGPALKDAALAYMRLVANYPRDPHVPQALLKTGALLERTNDSAAALNVYQQVARDYSDQPAGKEAKQAADRLAQAGK